MEYYKNRICVTFERLTRNDDGEAVMSAEIYRHYVRKNHFRFMRRGGGLGCYALIDFESLPPRYKARFIDKYGRPEEVLKDKPITEELAIDDAARTFYRGHTLPDGTRMTGEQIDEYTVNASVLNELIKLINDRRSKRRAHGCRAADFWGAILTTADNFREYPGHSLPKGKSQLQAKINDYKNNGYSALISGKLGNANSVKITDEMGDQIVALKRARVPVVYNNAQLFEEINRIAIERGWKPLRSEKSLVQFLHRPEVEPRWWDAVHGELSAKERYGRKNKTKMPSKRDSLWYSDGTKINLYYKAFDGGRLVVKTTSVYEVMDAYSETLLGFHISDTENFDAQYHAFRMAIETYRHRPYEIVNDNQGGHKKLTAVGFLDRITCAVSRRTAPYNPSSKTIESAFGRFQSQILHRDWRFTGQNITAKSDASRANLEFIEANKEFLYTLPELKEAYAKARQDWNMGLHPISDKPRLSMYLSSQNAEAKEVDDLDMMDIFWLQTAKPVEFTPNGITITVDKKKYTYEVFDAEGIPDLVFRRDNTYRKFVVMYDPLDLTHVRLFSQDKNGGLRYVTDAHPYACFARNIQEQKPGDMQFYRTMERLGKEERIRRQMEAAELETAYGVAPEQHGFNRPRMKGVSAQTAEQVMTAIANSAPREEIVDIGVAHKIISNQTPLEMGSRYDKI